MDREAVWGRECLESKIDNIQETKLNGLTQTKTVRKTGIRTYQCIEPQPPVAFMIRLIPCFLHWEPPHPFFPLCISLSFVLLPMYCFFKNLWRGQFLIYKFANPLPLQLRGQKSLRSTSNVISRVLRDSISHFSVGPSVRPSVTKLFKRHFTQNRHFKWFECF